MESIPRLAQRVLSVPFTPKYLKSCKKSRPLTSYLMQIHDSQKPVFIQWNLQGRPSLCTDLVSVKNYSSTTARAGWFLGMGEKKKQVLPDIMKAGDPVLHEPAQDVPLGEIGSERIQKIIDEMVKVMRNAPGVGLAAPQIGIPLKMIVLEDTNEYISYAPKDETKAQDRRPFDLLVIINPKLKKKGNKTALFFEGCLSVDGFRAVVERHLEVEVGGFDRNGKAIKVDASGWQARILQHEYDHLDGTLYVDKMVPRTFRTVENLDLPLAAGCPKLGVR
ncbi:peptide deformylase 1A, chloroplastic [Nicotiana tabacum]|uniref:Peptide deformylase n=1 Tax=Nicotiana tabacum TaxID=4097 RepID=A0A1S4BP03_TOBAC|nr:PREDICTED: peptide deformylase 1A, chloroplastic [Nicotiana tabacum]XP_016490617.1 PREDICTED: peptide deformylase 1A, chloroplastic [Nicotiana tabacum]XP_016490618.1 PREDICTED: peptide deformylase 1A, chloroplastic [Nicotiana tabacum]